MKEVIRVFENGLLKKICGPKTEKVTGNWRRLHNEELYKLDCLLNIIPVAKSRRM